MIKGEMIKGVKVVSICNLMDTLFPNHNSWEIPWEESCNALKKWCADNNATYYADPKEDFFIHKGVSKALGEGKNIVVIENLS